MFSALARVVCLVVIVFIDARLFAQEMFSDSSRSRISLDGTWQALSINTVNLQYPPPQNGAWKPIAIPGTYAAVIPSVQGPYMPAVTQYLNKEGTGFSRNGVLAAWFTRDFSVPSKTPAGYRAVLRFRGVAWRSETWLNDKKLGTWLLGQVPVEYDVTDILNANGNNHLVVGLTEREGLIDIKNKTYIAPAAGEVPGIWGNVELLYVPDLSVEDVFVKTSVKNKNIELETTVVNNSRAVRTFSARASIRDDANTVVTNVAGEAFTLKPGERKIVTLKRDWLAPRLWSSSDPALYIANVELVEQNHVTDSVRQRFGFREFEIRGRDFLLNGRRIVLLRNSTLRGIATQTDRVVMGIRDDLGNPFNCWRAHLGLVPDSMFDAADEMGMLLVPEFGWWHVNKFPIEARDIWLGNTLAYARAFVKKYRNHPSVIIWSLTNETYWGRNDPGEMAVADKMIETVSGLDPTRPLQGDGEVTWNNRLPIINIHYPEGEIGNSYREKFPNSGLVYPNDFYWLSTDPKVENTSWRAKFKWDRPLVLGEYWLTNDSDTDFYSSFMGEQAADWPRWKNESYSGERGRPLNEWALALQRQTDAYRLLGVAGMNPWSGDRMDAMPPVAARPLNFHTNYFGGATATRKIVVYNDGLNSYNRMSLLCQLINEKGDILWEKNVPAYVNPGEVKSVDVAVDLPQVETMMRATFSVRHHWQRGPNWVSLGRFADTLYIMPRERLSDVNANQIVLLDPSQKTAATLKDAGLDVAPLTSLTADALRDRKLLIIGEDTNPMPYQKQIVDFVRAGGAALVLHQENSAPLTPELPEVDPAHATSRSWLRVFNHPITSGMDDAQFSYWQPDHLVAVKSLRKSNLGSVRHLLDSGGRFGMNWSPLAETAVGSGRFVQIQFRVTGAATAEPAAIHLLAQSIRYALTAGSSESQPMRVLAADQPAVLATLQAASVVTTKDMTAGTGPIFIQGGSTITDAQLSALRTHLSAGGTLWLHGFNSEKDLASIAPLFPFKPALMPVPADTRGGARRSTDPFISNISTLDLAWTNRGAGRDVKPALGSVMLKVPDTQRCEILMEPAMLVKIPVSKGAILFDTLQWQDALGVDADRVLRVVGSLAYNLGAAVKLEGDQQTYSYTGVDLSNAANMGYYDQKAEDGQGGWTDQGEDDMRYFLTDHVGKLGEMDIATAPFPAQADLAGRPFWLLDPKKTRNHAIVSLRGGDHAKLLPESAKGITINHKADRIWFVHAAAWGPQSPNQEVARYVMHYNDGTQAAFSIRYGVEVSDWWDPKPLARAKVAWSGRSTNHTPVGMYQAEWANPHPDKTIVSMDIIGNITATQFVTVAITLGTNSQPAPAVPQTRMTPRADWNLADLAQNRIRNRVAGAAELQSTDKPPTLTDLGGTKTLRFREGQSLMSDVRKIPGMLTGGPIAVRATITPEEKPSGYCGGIVEAMSHMKAGFRLVQQQDLKLAVEIFTGPNSAKYLVSKDPLTLGRTYDVAFLCDGRYARLLIDGKLDNMIETAPPAAFSGLLRIGVASGKDYFFNGCIQRVAMDAE